MLPTATVIFSHRFYINYLVMMMTYDDECLQLQVLATPTLNYKPSTGKQELRIGCVHGNAHGNSWAPFKVALSKTLTALEKELKDRNIEPVIVEYSIKEIRSQTWTEADFVNELLGCHVHFIVTHVHQGIEFFNAKKLLAEMERLTYHPGWPSGDKLCCPIFQQDKFPYLVAVQDMCNPTLYIPLGSEVKPLSKVRVTVVLLVCVSL